MKRSIYLIVCMFFFLQSCEREVKAVYFSQDFPQEEKAPICINKEDKLALKAIYNSLNGANWERVWDFDDSITWKGVTIALESSKREYRVVYLNLKDDQLKGTIPDSIRLLSELILLQIEGKGVTGSLPDGFFELRALQEIGIYNTSLTTERFDQFHRLKNLAWVNIAYHSFNAPMTGTFEQLEHLEQLYLGFNNFTGALPASFVTCKGLVYLQDNNITEVPLVYWSTLSRIYLQNNRLSGEIPLEIQKTPLFREKYNMFIYEQQEEYGYTNIIY